MSRRLSSFGFSTTKTRLFSSLHSERQMFPKASVAMAMQVAAANAWAHAPLRFTHTVSPTFSTNPTVRYFASKVKGSDVLDETPPANENEFATSYHAPVMWKECIDALLECRTSEDSGKLVLVDGTLGGGGHSAALLERLQAGDIVLGCDVDSEALATASERLCDYQNHDGTAKPLFIPFQSNFAHLTKTLPEILHPHTQEPILETSNDGVDGILLDLGVSSYQIDTPERGFAFMKDGPLDMRMNAGYADAISSGFTAADICNEFDAKELQRIFSVYGDEPRAKTVAEAIVRHRPLQTTGQLVEAIASVTPAFAKHKRKGRTATCARIFQSLRIVVNKEDQVLEQVLAETCPALIRPGGRLVVLSYHSMEDRATKRIMRDGTMKRRRVEKDLYGNTLGPPKPFRPIGKRRTAGPEEVETNPRARSASLRVAERL